MNMSLEAFIGRMVARFMDSGILERVFDYLASCTTFSRVFETIIVSLIGLSMGYSDWYRFGKDTE